MEIDRSGSSIYTLRLSYTAQQREADWLIITRQGKRSPMTIGTHYGPHPHEGLSRGLRPAICRVLPYLLLDAALLLLRPNGPIKLLR